MSYVMALFTMSNYQPNKLIKEIDNEATETNYC